jgi:hypothetical protein
MLMKTPPLLLMCALCMFAVAPFHGIRQVDFTNFTYPWCETDSWPDHLEWLDPSERNRVRLVNGRWAQPQDRIATSTSFKLPFSGLTFDEVLYGDLTGDAQEEAVVVLRFDSGGTQYYYYVYIYSLESGHPKLLGYFHTGDRASQGLYRVYAQRGSLVVELYDPDKRQGDCCSSGFLRTRHRWRGGIFDTLGRTERGSPITVSRRRVTVFGLPHQPH